MKVVLDRFPQFRCNITFSDPQQLKSASDDIIHVGITYVENHKTAIIKMEKEDSIKGSRTLLEHHQQATSSEHIQVNINNGIYREA